MMKLVCMVLTMLAMLSGFAVSKSIAVKGGKKNMESTIPLEWKSIGKPKYFAYKGQFAQGVRGRAILNGITIQSSGGDGSSMSSNVPQYFLKSGKNLLKLEILEYVPSQTNDSVKISFHSSEDGGIPRDTNRAAHILIKADELKFSLYREYLFELKEAPESKLLLAAEPVAAVTSADRQAIEILLLEFIKALKTADFDLYKKLMEHAFRDQAECIHSSPESYADSMKKYFPDFASRYTKAGFDLSQLRLAPVLDGRVWLLVTEKNQAFLSTDSVTMNLGVSKVKGEWLYSRTIGNVDPVPPPHKKLEELRRLGKEGHFPIRK